MREPKYLTGMQGNRKKCLDCSCFSSSGVRDCTAIDCVNWPGRFGIRPRTAARKGYAVNPYEVAGKEYGEGVFSGTYKELAEDEPLWWELPIREIVRRYGLK